MKNSSKTIILTLTMFYIYNSTIKATNNSNYGHVPKDSLIFKKTDFSRKSKWTINVGTGLNSFSAFVAARYISGLGDDKKNVYQINWMKTLEEPYNNDKTQFAKDSSYYYNYNFKNANVDYKRILTLEANYNFSERLSCGIGFGYQKVSVSNLYYSDYVKSTKIKSEYAFSDSYQLFNITGQMQLHLIKNRRLDWYIGLRGGYNYYTASTNLSSSAINRSTYLNDFILKPIALSTQLSTGLNYYFHQNFGINAEIGAGYGSPYHNKFGFIAKF